MGRCIAIETVRARRALRNASAPSASIGADRIKAASRASCVKRARSGILWSLSGWLWIAIRQMLGGQQRETVGQQRRTVPAFMPEADKRPPNKNGSIR